MDTAAVELRGSARDYHPLLERIGDAQLALLGEASHGTHEFYRERAEVTKRLLAEKGFSTVLVEADWPDAYRVNRYVRGASDDLDAAETLRPALAGSYEALFHEAHLDRFLLTSEGPARSHLQKARLERAIGVIYRPATERLSHYFDATLPEQFDAILHFDETHAVEPLAINAEWQAGEVPETYPFGV